MDNWYDRDNYFVDKDGLYDDSWLKPNTDVWRSIHPFGYNQYEYDNPWGTRDNDSYEDS